jgi:tRNA (guanine37-N1)-methyltransferase
MRFDLVTLFPELIAPHLVHGITRRAFEGPLQVRCWNPREHSDDSYRRVDDRPYGGGPGMVMLAEPLLRTLDAIGADRAAELPPEVIHFTPTGRHIDQALVQRLAAGPGAVLICGRYEGIDQRLIDHRVTLELSLGDFVLSGGEIAALALLDAVARLQPGVLTEPSHQSDSFSDGLLEGPQFSRPEVLVVDGQPRPVPAVLLSGHHADIARWRRERSLELTARRRPDLIAAARAAGRLSPADERFLARLPVQPGSEPGLL